MHHARSVEVLGLVGEERVMSSDNHSNFRALTVPAKRGAQLTLFALLDRTLLQNSSLADFDHHYRPRSF